MKRWPILTLLVVVAACDDGSSKEDGTADPAGAATGAAAETHATPTPSASTSAAALDDKPPDDSQAERAKDGAIMVRVPAGPFVRGSIAGVGDDDERPQRTLTIRAFYIDRTEITRAMYAGCVDSGGCKAPARAAGQCNWPASGRDEHPINCVIWPEADAYCRWAGARLPTEAEWEKAARGTRGQAYPWGDEAPTCARAVMPDPATPAGRGCGKVSTWPVGSKPDGASPYGALDMSGNVWEWVADHYADSYYARAPADDPSGPSRGSPRAIRGGGWEIHDSDHLRAANRFRFAPTFRFHGVGFRCAQSS